MLELKNVTKIYKSRSGKECVALDDVDLTLADNGLFFVCGKSGSGKTTLLNVLGGLDKPTEGTVSFDGNILTALKDNELSDYRNSIVGFVFQEYNLIENINVEKNIGIALSLQNCSRDKILISEALEKVGLKGYEKQRINELSGGQKQRVAIARALVKNPQIILADEPTGNLDISTSKEIFKLLKELSQERLIVIVTHDVEAAKYFTQYLIGIKDGKIVYNNCPKTNKNTAVVIKQHEIMVEERNVKAVVVEHNDIAAEEAQSEEGAYSKQELTNNTYASIKTKSEIEPISQSAIKNELSTYCNNEIKKHKSSLPFGVIIKMGIGNLLKKPIRSISALLVITITIICIIVSQLFFSNFGNSHINVQARLMTNSETGVFSLNFKKHNSSQHPFRYGIPDYISANYPQIQYLDSSTFSLTIESSQDVLNFGYEFVGNYLELDDNSIYVTLTKLNIMYRNPRYFVRGDDGLFTKLTENEYPPEKVVGKEIREEMSNTQYFTIGGIIKTDKLLKSTNYLESNFISFYIEKTFHLKNYVNRVFAESIELENTKLNDVNLESLRFTSTRSTKLGGVIILNDGTVGFFKDLDLAPTDMVLSLEVYNQLFNRKSTIYEYLTITKDGNKTQYNLRKKPEHLGEEIELSLLEEYSNTSFASKYTLKGVMFDFLEQELYREEIIFSKEEYNNLYINYYDLISTTNLVINKNTVDNFKSFFTDMHNQGITVETPYNTYLNDMQNEFSETASIMTFISIFLGVVMILLVVNLISIGILARTKELGILKALGAKNKDLYGIFFVESFVIAFIPFATCSILSFFCCKILNIIYSINFGLQIFVVGFGTFLTIFIASFVMVFLATIIPLLKIKKLNPIDAIKTVN